MSSRSKVNPLEAPLPALRSLAAPTEVTRSAFWIETFLIPIVAIALAWMMRPEDPTLARVSFPWLWFAPALVALRYGVMAGLLATTPLIANWFITTLVFGDLGPFPQVHFFGGILLTLLCGEFADIWRDRHEQLEEANAYLVERVSRLTRRHLLLNLSHDRLEQEMLARPGSLRDALVHLRESVLNRLNNEPLPAAAELLQILAQYTNIQAASLHLVDPRNQRIGPAIVKLGEPEPLSSDDVLLGTALASGQLAHVAEYVPTSSAGTNQKVVAPVQASDQTLLAVLAVSQIPFFSLNVENLQFLEIILGYYADCVHHAPAIAQVRSRLPAIPPFFAEELVRMIALQKRFCLDSQIVVMHFKGAQGEEIIEQLIRIKRGIDLYWQTYVGKTPVLAVLLPFASPAGKEGYLNRIQNWLRSRFGGDFETLGISLHTIDFASQDPIAELEHQLKQ